MAVFTLFDAVIVVIGVDTAFFSLTPQETRTGMELPYTTLGLILLSWTVRETIAHSVVRYTVCSGTFECLRTLMIGADVIEEMSTTRTVEEGRVRTVKHTESVVGVLS